MTLEQAQARFGTHNPDVWAVGENLLAVELYDALTDSGVVIYISRDAVKAQALVEVAKLYEADGDAR